MTQDTAIVIHDKQDYYDIEDRSITGAPIVATVGTKAEARDRARGLAADGQPIRWAGFSSGHVRKGDPNWMDRFSDSGVIW